MVLPFKKIKKKPRKKKIQKNKKTKKIKQKALMIP